MASTGSAIAILPIGLGLAAAFDQKEFPQEYYEADDNLSKGSVLISATLQEMEIIRQLGINLDNNGDFIYNARTKIEALEVDYEKLVDNPKTFNPYKAFQKYKTAREFHSKSKTLYRQTRRTSEKIHRKAGCVRVVPSTQMRMIKGAVSPDTKVVGIAVELPDGMNDDAQQTINGAGAVIAANPFANDPLISQLRDDEQEITLADTASILSQDVPGSGIDEGNQTSVAPSDLQPSRPTSPQTINYFQIIQHSTVTTATNSNLTGVTANRGSWNSGASVTQEFGP